MCKSVASERLANSTSRVLGIDWLIVAAICIGALLIRLHAIDEASLWTDEGYSIWFARQPLGELWGEIARNEYNPILYYMILHLWMDVFGESATSLRALSAVINCLTIPFIYLATRWAIRSPQAPLVATLAAGLFALAFAELQYAQEARTYTLCVLAIAIAIAASVRISAALLDDAAETENVLPYWPFALLAIGAALSVWAHYASLIFLAVLGLYHLGLVWLCRDRLPELLRKYGLSALLFALLAGRALWLMLAYALPASDDFWISVPSPTDVIDAASIIFGGALAMDSWGLQVLARALLFGLWPLIGAYMLWSRGHRLERASLILLVATSVVAFAAYLLVTYMGKPVFLQRIVLPAQIGWIVLCAASLLAFRSNLYRRVAAGLLVAAFSASTLSYMVGGNQASVKEPWKTVSRQIADQAGPGETVYVTATGEILVGYYLDRFGRGDLNLVSVNGSYRTPAARPAFDKTAIRYMEPINATLVHGLRESLDAAPSAWMVLRNPDGSNWHEIKAVLHDANAVETVFEPGPLSLFRIDKRLEEGTPIASATP